MTPPDTQALDVQLKACPNPWCCSTTRPLPVALKRDGWRVACACGVHTYRAATEAEAITAWNTRAALQPAETDETAAARLLLETATPSQSEDGSLVFVLTKQDRADILAPPFLPRSIGRGGGMTVYEPCVCKSRPSYSSRIAQSAKAKRIGRIARPVRSTSVGRSTHAMRCSPANNPDREGIRLEAFEEAAKVLTDKADLMRGSSTGDMMARIFDEQATAIRALIRGDDHAQ